MSQPYLTDPSLTGVAALFVPCSLLIDRCVAVIVDIVAELYAALDTVIGVADVTKPVSIAVVLLRVCASNAVITEVTDPITVAVELVWIGDLWAVVIALADPIEIAKLISADSPKGAEQHQRSIGDRAVISPAAPVPLAGPATVFILSRDKLPREVVVPTHGLFWVAVRGWVTDTSDAVLIDPREPKVRGYLKRL